MSAFSSRQQYSRGAKYMDLYFERYHGVLEYMERTRALRQEQGYVETLERTPPLPAGY